MRKKIKLQKASTGLQDVTVPQKGSMSSVTSSALSLAATGASVGGPAAPWVAAAGAVAGVGMGLIEKNKMDKAHKKATALNTERKAMRMLTGEDETLSQSMQTFSKGAKATANSKLIEVEKDELIFSKNGNQFQLKADFTGGKSHKEGGEPYVAKEGDVIFPGNKRKEVMSAYNSGDHARLESMRMKLPKDTNSKGEAENGFDNSPKKNEDYATYKARVLKEMKAKAAEAKSSGDDVLYKQIRENLEGIALGKIDIKQASERMNAYNVRTPVHASDADRNRSILDYNVSQLKEKQRILTEKAKNARTQDERLKYRQEANKVNEQLQTQVETYRKQNQSIASNRVDQKLKNASLSNGLPTFEKGESVPAPVVQQASIGSSALDALSNVTIPTGGNSTPASAIGNTKGVAVNPNEKMPLRKGTRQTPRLEMDIEGLEYGVVKRRADSEEAKIMGSVKKGVELQQSMNAHEKVKNKVGSQATGNSGPEVKGFWNNVTSGWEAFDKRQTAAGNKAQKAVKGLFNDGLSALTGLVGGDDKGMGFSRYPIGTKTAGNKNEGFLFNERPYGNRVPSASTSTVESGAPATETPVATTGGTGGGTGGRKKKVAAKDTTPKGWVNPEAGKDILTPAVSTLTGSVNEFINKPTKDVGIGSPIAKDIKPLASPIAKQTGMEKASAHWNSVKNVVGDAAKGVDVNTMLSLAGVANNLAQSFGSPDKVKENYVTPEQLKYRDRSQTSRYYSNAAQNASISNSRNMSGGSAGNARSNAEQAYADNAGRQMQISAQEASRADEISAQNVVSRNRANEVNAQRSDAYQDINMRNAAAKQSYREQALSDIGQFAQIRRQEGYMRERDSKLDQLERDKLDQMNKWTNFELAKDGSLKFRGPIYSNAMNKEATTVKEETKSGNTKVTKTTTKPLSAAQKRRGGTN
jgi:hypothetical protein